MSASNECVITFPIVGGIFGVGQLASRLNALLSAGQIGPWHIGRWINFKHAAIRIQFNSVADGETASLLIGSHFDPSGAVVIAGPRLISLPGSET